MTFLPCPSHTHCTHTTNTHFTHTQIVKCFPLAVHRGERFVQQTSAQILFVPTSPSVCVRVAAGGVPTSDSDCSSTFSPVVVSPPDLSGRPEDPPDAAAGGEGLHQLLVLRDQADGLRGLRLSQRETLPLPGRHRIHLPNQQQRLPLGPMHPRNTHTYGGGRTDVQHLLPPGRSHCTHRLSERTQRPQTETLHTHTDS